MGSLTDLGEYIDIDKPPGSSSPGLKGAQTRDTDSQGGSSGGSVVNVPGGSLDSGRAQGCTSASQRERDNVHSGPDCPPPPAPEHMAAPDSHSAEEVTVVSSVQYLTNKSDTTTTRPGGITNDIPARETSVC